MNIQQTAAKAAKHKRFDYSGDVAETLMYVKKCEDKHRALAYWCFQFGIDLQELADLVEAKNKAYGGAIEDPIYLFSEASTAERIAIQLDNKASRIVRGAAYETEDDKKDFAGYLLLLAALEGAA